MYTNVIFQITTNAANVKAFVEKNELRFNDQGIAAMALAEGQQYSLYCFASGKSGSSYELSIIEPTDIPFRIFKTIDSSNIESGKYSFTVSYQEEFSVYLP